MSAELNGGVKYGSSRKLSGRTSLFRLESRLFISPSFWTSFFAKTALVSPGP